MISSGRVEWDKSFISNVRAVQKRIIIVYELLTVALAMISNSAPNHGSTPRTRRKYFCSQ